VTIVAIKLAIATLKTLWTEQPDKKKDNSALGQTKWMDYEH
jgi:hypothetical protein